LSRFYHLSKKSDAFKSSCAYGLGQNALMADRDGQGTTTLNINGSIYKPKKAERIPRQTTRLSLIFFLAAPLPVLVAQQVSAAHQSDADGRAG
jgi:hypothetical protein